VGRYLGGQATHEEARRLEALLLEDPQLRTDFLAYARLDSALPVVAVHKQIEASTTPAKFRGVHRLALVAAAVMLILSAGLFWFRRPSDALAVLGTITRVHEAEIQGDRPRLVAGQPVRAGRWNLVNGLVEFTLNNGVTLVLEGPGELELFSSMRAAMQSGQVVVRVPEKAIGFELNSPAASVVDLGTEFAIKVGPDLETDVQVFEGAVVATGARSGFPSRMEAGTASRFNLEATSAPLKLEFSETRFLRHIPNIIKPGVPLPESIGGADLAPPARHAEVDIHAVPATTPIRIDGELSDWSDDGRFRAAMDGSRSVDGRMRYDTEALYIAAQIKDPFPMRNVIDPEMDPENSWRGGSLEVRLGLDRAAGWPLDASGSNYYRWHNVTASPEDIARAANPRISQLMLWHNAPAKRDVLYLRFGMDFHGALLDSPGHQLVFKRDSDGKGYAVEARIPWAVLGVADDPPQAGDVLSVCWQIHWSDESGRLPHGNLVEIRNPAEPQRIYTFTRAATWGRAVFQ
jgi:hypothetical protein